MRFGYAKMRHQQRAQNASLGFLDVTFGGLGIFVVIFAIRITMVFNQGGVAPDMLVFISGGETREQSRIVLYTKSEKFDFSGQHTEVAEKVLGQLRIFSRTALHPLRIEVSLTENGFEGHLFLESELSDARRANGDDYLPFVMELIATKDEETFMILLEEWMALTSQSVQNE